MDQDGGQNRDPAEGLFRTLIESLPQNIFSMDREGRYTFANRAYCLTEKLDLETLVGKTSFDLHPWDLAAKYEADNRTVMETQVPLELVEEHVTPAGDKSYVQVIKTPVYDRNREVVGVLGAFWDVTALKSAEEVQRDLNQLLKEEIDLRTKLFYQFRAELERQVKERTEDLVRSEKMAALGRVVAGVAHEINTPVGIAVTAGSFLGSQIKRIRDLVESGQLSKESLVEFLDQGLEASDIFQKNLFRAVELVDTFKKVAVDQSSEARRPFLFGEYLQDLVRHLHYSLKSRNVRVEVLCPEGLAMDNFPGVLYQIITNLVNNSLLHGFSGDRSGTIVLEARDAGELVELDYSDDGVGIDSQNLPLIFDPFFTTKRGQGGSGLGLHIVFNLVTQKLRGTIRCESAPDAGCRFFLRLPKRAVDPGTP